MEAELVALWYSSRGLDALYNERPVYLMFGVFSS